MTANPWQPAPTCAGWWWFWEDGEAAPVVVQVVPCDWWEAGPQLAFLGTDPGRYHYASPGSHPGRWSGPLTPPGDEG